VVVDRIIDRDTPGASTSISRDYGGYSTHRLAICKQNVAWPETGRNSEFGRDLKMTADTDKYSTIGSRTDFKTTKIVTAIGRTSFKEFSSSNLGGHSAYCTCSQCSILKHPTHSRPSCTIQEEPSPYNDATGDYQRRFIRDEVVPSRYDADKIKYQGDEVVPSRYDADKIKYQGDEVVPSRYNDNTRNYQAQFTRDEVVPSRYNDNTGNYQGRFTRDEVVSSRYIDDIGNYQGRFTRDEVVSSRYSDDTDNYLGRFTRDEVVPSRYDDDTGNYQERFTRDEVVSKQRYY